MRRRHALTTRDSVLGTLSVLLCLVGCGCVGFGVAMVPGHLHIWPYTSVLPLCALIWLGTLGFFTQKISAVGLQWGATLIAALMALPIALFWPGMAHLWGMPVLAALVGWLLDFRTASPGIRPSVLALGTAAILWFPLLEGVRIALGPGSLIPLSIGLGLVFMWALPLTQKEVIP